MEREAMAFEETGERTLRGTHLRLGSCSSSSTSRLTLVAAHDARGSVRGRSAGVRRGGPARASNYELHNEGGAHRLC
eukprot:3879837-Prymnesium_polylepis.1